MVASVLVVLLMGLAGWALVELRHLLTDQDVAARAWAEVEDRMARRHRLVAALLARAASLVPRESDALLAVADALDAARGGAGDGPKERAALEATLSDAVALLADMAREVPSLGADADIHRLLAEAESLRRRIGIVGEMYNDAARRLAALLRRPPAMWIAPLIGVAGVQGFKPEKTRRPLALEYEGEEV